MFFFLPARLSVSFLTQIQTQWEKKTSERRRRGEKKRNDEGSGGQQERGGGEEDEGRAAEWRGKTTEEESAGASLRLSLLIVRRRTAVRGNQRFCSLSDRKQKLCCRLESQILTHRYFVTETTESKRKITRTSSDNEETVTPCSPRGLGLKVRRAVGWVERWRTFNLLQDLTLPPLSALAPPSLRPQPQNWSEDRRTSEGTNRTSLTQQIVRLCSDDDSVAAAADIKHSHIHFKVSSEEAANQNWPPHLRKRPNTT